jgi:DegV family protein with EDD domain
MAETAESIVSVHISSELSGTIASAHAASKLMEDFPIEIVDSRSTSMGLGYLALVAAQAIEQGADYKEAAAAARAILPHLHLVFVVDTLEYLHRGGRIGGAQRLFGSMLSIKPLLQLEDGRIEPLDKVRTKSKAVQRLLEIAAESVQGASACHVTVLNAAAAAEAESLAAQVQDLLKPNSLNIVEISPVIGTHTGPAALGLAWYTEP